MLKPTLIPITPDTQRVITHLLAEHGRLTLNQLDELVHHPVDLASALGLNENDYTAVTEEVHAIWSDNDGTMLITHAEAHSLPLTPHNCPRCQGELSKLEDGTLYCEEDECLRAYSLAAHLGCEPEDIEVCKYDEQLFVVNSRPVKRGTSPTEAARLVARVRAALEVALGDETREWRSGVPWMIGDVHVTYSMAAKALQDNEVTAPMLREGIHDIINTLYFVSEDTNNYDHATGHKSTLREAFDGVEPEDRRRSEVADDGEYLILTAREADARVSRSIEESLWAFNASFLAGYTHLPEEVFAALQEKCEGANDSILQLVKRSDGGLGGFVKEAVDADGRGHFLAGYDNEENEVRSIKGDETYYIYRVN